MNPVDVLPYVTGAGGAIAVLLFGYALVLMGHFVPGNMHREVVVAYKERLAEKDQRIAALEAASVADRNRADIAVEAARSSRDLLLGLQQAARQLPAGDTTG